MCENEISLKDDGFLVSFLEGLGSECFSKKKAF